MPIRPETIASGARFVGIGFSLAGTVVAALWLGAWLDDRWGTSPLFLLIFLTGGLFGFIRRLLWMLGNPGTGSGERGTGNGEPGAGNRERGKGGEEWPGDG